MIKKHTIYLFFTVFFCFHETYSQCGLGTPSFTADLTSSPSATYQSPSVPRNDTCCGWSGSDNCIKFTLLLHPNSIGINFGLASGAVPPGALYYSINCGPPIAVGSPICLSGAGPHIITFCKPGNNSNSYSITTIPKPVVPDSIMVRNGCTQTLAVTGFSVPTITWNSINPGSSGAYNSYLNCTSGCASVVVTPTGTPPPFVDYLVGGFAQSPCQASYYQDTVRVYFYSNLLAGINPTLTTICFGSTNALLTATASGGLPAYTYSWLPGGSTNTSVVVGPGTYTVQVYDKTGCPPTTATAVVNQYTLPISANAGPDFTICKGSPTVALSGTVTNATGGTWSGGTGTFSPVSNSVSTNYIPTSAELTAGSVQLYLTTTGNSGCPPDKDTVVVSFQNIPLSNAGPNATVCANNSTVNLSGTVTGFASTGQWSTAGNGVFTSSTNLNTSYMPGTGDISAGSVIITLSSTGNGVCPPATSTLQILITPSPTVNAGTGSFVCSTATVSLNGNVTGATSTGSWSTSGNGSFFPSTTALNASYTPGSADITAGTVTLTLSSTNNNNCLVVSDTVIINIKKIATVNAGLNQLSCANTGTIALNGLVGGGSISGSWASSGGGSFSPNNITLNNTYAITSVDISSGSVIFTLTSTNNGPCPAVSDTVQMIITKPATVTAGANQFLCSNAGVINLNGAVSSSSNTGFWMSTSSGASGFNPSNTSLTASYVLNAVDLSTGSVTFSLTSTNNGACPAITDTVKMTIKQLAIVNAGLNQALCSNASFAALSGTVSGGTNSGIWSGSSGGSFSPTNTTLNGGSYFFSNADILSGAFTLTLSSTGNGPCPVVADTVKMAITQFATVSAGSNQFVCSNAGVINLAGAVNSSSNTGFWLSGSSGSGGFNPSNAALSTSYSLNPSDISNGSVTFSLTSTNNGVCPAITDTVKIKIKLVTIVNAGTNQFICSNTSSLTLSGTVGGGSTSGNWSTSGTGGFNPGSTSLNNTYFVSVADVAAGFINFTLTAAASSPCPAIIDTMVVFITPVSVVNAGSNQFICSLTKTLSLNGSVTGGANTGAWVSSGGGTFLPNNTSLSITYSLSASDANNGTVTFTLASPANGVCPIVRDTVLIKIKKPAIVSAGPDQTICSTTLNAPLNGTISAGSSTGIWSPNGSGNILPANTSLNGTYNVTTADINNGAVSFILTSTNNEVCPAVSDTSRLFIIKKPVINLIQDTTICSYQNPLKVTANVSGGSGAYQWSTSGSGSFVFASGLNSVYYNMSASDITTGSVKLTISSINNGPCGDFSSGINVMIHPSPDAQFTASTFVANIPNDPIQFTNQSSGATSYYWNFGDGGFTNLANPLHNYVAVGFYTVSLVAVNQFNCRDTVAKQVKVISDIQFPNVFTPNASGGSGGGYNPADLSNDIFFPYTSGVTEYHLMIFNRWGELIFESRDINIGWDGYFNGKLCQQDAYVWKAEVKFFDGRKFNKVGSVTLLR